MTSSPHRSSSRPIELGLAAAIVAAFWVAAVAGKAKTGAVTGTVTVHGGGLDNVIVYVADVEDGKTTTASIKQKDLTYVPFLTVVPVGSRVWFPNKDKGIIHNVFSPKSGDEPFNLGAYKAGKSKAHVFDTPGEIDIYCDRHADMRAKVKVVPSSLWTRVDDQGHYRLDGVPVGTHKIEVWMPDTRPVRTTVTVTEDGTVEANPLDLHAGKAPAHHKRVDGTSYPDYD